MIEESIEAIASSEIIQQVLDRDARAGENWSAAEHIRVGSDDGFKSRHVCSALHSMVHPTGCGD
ncbi:MAG: hypothetical protein A3H96_04905 [Acidobacteria bacterium RIFCSPLOWO2_02_FULL_67_36]|nr:MAG: hypothetical protein A3H96_04905 [Acidobacteria bacterium RIFCSPLOWO2_02_FULL_67_36]OFW26428.1 MAG: hypothetical protein A3G21_27505 [Acidobacteria bacterium RIFCSPLOWO2_12_FULL_66_21]